MRSISINGLTKKYLYVQYTLDEGSLWIWIILIDLIEEYLIKRRGFSIQEGRYYLEGISLMKGLLKSI